MKNSTKLLALGILLAVAACGSPATPSAPASGASLKVEDWPTGQVGKLVFAYPGTPTFAEATVDANGAFTYALPNAPDSVLKAFSFSSTDCSVTPTVTPADARISSPFAAINATAGSASGRIIIATKKPTRASIAGTLTVGDVLIEHVYAEKDVSVQGRLDCRFGATGTFNLNLKKGWSYLISTVMELPTGKGPRFDITSTATLPTGAKWYYVVPAAAARQ